MPIAMLREFFRLEAASGILLVLAAIAALAIVNSPIGWIYSELLGTPVEIRVGALRLAKPLLLWINDGLMAVFFLLVALEVKREVVEGHLSSFRTAALPAIAAVGGMAAPAAIFVAVNSGAPENLGGWAVPTATDIAFALAVMSLLGARVPTSLKVFLLAIAIIDDLGAIVIIAIFYTADLSLLSLGLAGAALAVLFILNLAGVQRVAAYVLVGIVLWVCVLESGVHATLTGVALAFAIPMRPPYPDDESLLARFEHALHPWVAYGIMPLFAFGNAGVLLAGVSLAQLAAPLPLGITLGLFLGKQAGVMAACWIAVRLRAGGLPEGASWMQVYGAAVLTGIGFTMSLFIGTLAFDDAERLDAVKLGVIAGSLASGVLGYLVLWLSSGRRGA